MARIQIQGIIQLCEQIVRFGIRIQELLAFHATSDSLKFADENIDNKAYFLEFVTWI
jgi:hypothetical protein